MTRLGEFLALSSRRRRLLVVALGSVLACRATLALGSVGHTRRLLGAVVPATTPRRREGTAPIADLAWAARTADALVPGSGTCLHAALVANELFAAHDHDASIRIGVATDGPEFEAHAWVESDGRGVVVGDLHDLDRFRPLPLDAIDRLGR